MYQAITTPRAVPVVLPEDLASFGRFDCPEQYTSTSPLVTNPDYTLLQTFIEAATDQIEIMAQTAMITESIVETYDFFPGTQDPRQLLDYQLSYAYDWAPFWWYGGMTKDSIELVRRPVQPGDVVVTYNEAVDGALQTLDPSTYTVQYNKITLNVGSCWPQTDRRQDCVQINFTAGYGGAAATVPAQLTLAVMFLAAHFYDNRQIVTVAPTSEIHMTLCALLKPFRSMRLPR